LKEYSSFIRKAVNEIPSFAATSLLEIFGTIDSLTDAISEKNYEFLLTKLLKTISTMLVAEYEDYEKTPERLQQNKELSYEELKTRTPPVPEGQTRLMRNSIEDYINSEKKSSPGNKNEQIYICDNESQDFVIQTDRKMDPKRNVRSLIASQKNRRQISAFSKGSVKGKLHRPVFDNYTKKTSNYFDPFLQFGGETMYSLY